MCAGLRPEDGDDIWSWKTMQKRTSKETHLRILQGLIPQGSDGGGENKKADAGCVLRTEAVHEGSVVEKQCNFIREKKQCKGRGVVTRICLHIWQMEQLNRTDM